MHCDNAVPIATLRPTASVCVFGNEARRALVKHEASDKN